MGDRSRARRAQRAIYVTAALPLLRAVTRWVQRLRPARAWRWGLLIGELLRWLGVTRDIVRRNVDVACGGRPSPGTLARFEAAYYRHLGLLVIEFLRQPLVTAATLPDHVEGDGFARVLRIVAEGNGAICVAGHAGLWELAGHGGACAGGKLISVAKLSDHPGLDAWVGSIREAGGNKIQDVRGSMWPMKKALDRGEVVGINIDQEVREGAVHVPFFGVLAATSTAPALLHRRTGAPIAVITVHRVGRFRYRAELFDEIRHPKTDDADADVKAITARINRAMEAAIRRHPEQWLWSHRRWRRRPPDEPAPFARVDATPPLAL